MELAGEVALVTGAGGGIGRAIALALSRAGAHVSVCDVDAQGVDETVRLITEASAVQALGMTADVSKIDDVTEVVDTTRERLGLISILVNNAGITRDGITPKLDEEMWDKVLDINLKGAFICTKKVIPQMKERLKGAIVSLSSRSYLGNYGQSNYAASKGGIVGLTRSLALEAGPFGIRVNALAPGYIDSPMTRGTIGDRVDQVRAASALRTIGKPDDIADVVTYLVSDNSRYITGQTLNVCGGRSIGQLLF